MVAPDCFKSAVFSDLENQIFKERLLRKSFIQSISTDLPVQKVCLTNCNTLLSSSRKNLSRAHIEKHIGLS